MLSNVTAIIKTFLRDEYFFECVKSLRDKYPEIKIFVFDDGIKTLEKDRFVAEYCDLYLTGEYDTSLSKARNKLISHVETPFYLIGDDDFYYKDTHNLGDLVKLMDIADIAGGSISEHGCNKHYEGFFVEEGDTLCWNKLEINNSNVYQGINYFPVDFTFNFYIAKKEVGQKAKYDENIKVAYEHADFFLRAKDNNFKVVYAPDVCAVHKPDHVIIKEGDNKAYAEFRLRKSDRDYALKKWGYKFYKDINGFVDSL